jgi:hypothetical protein
VKRWSPWFPVLPTEDCWANGINEYSFLIFPQAKDMSNAIIHKIGMEFNTDTLVRKSSHPVVELVPDNVVAVPIHSKEKGLECVFYETKGEATEITIFKDKIYLEPFGIGTAIVPHKNNCNGEL